jgi:hypothetical protein
MIKANELRVGSWVLYPHTQNELFHITEPRQIELAYILLPIAITPEWLERCGFEKRLINNSFFEYHLPCTPPHYRNEYKLRWWDAETFRSLEWVTVESGSIHKFPCAYLHQLQNLYFALTGEELNVKL